ncbi:UDP-phosphate galactose phosphotransferase [Burkholderia sp. WAC0059]|uniref:sugar transferase n=1 Tax=Burkholderia sp. WAC0059 TaxID=2066022 RepID=UPI000C7F24FA|nr:sugar transferase [Burkholderia sp. WAC0059]PLZ03569.1 UDP-phosphate galactose phosphotransferase [Burkholderia sp. WAC0059]
MSGLLHRAIDIGLIVLGAVGVLHLKPLASGGPHAFDASLVAFVAALALSVFPACGAYASRGVRSVAGVAGRTTFAWLAVQVCGLVLLYAIHRTRPLPMPWFFDWTLATGASLLVSHTLTYVVFDVASPAMRRAFGAAYRAGRDVAAGGPSHAAAAGYAMKRCFDVALGVALLIVLSPVLTALALAVMSDGGPAVFAHVRVGRHGRRFRCLKFRSMVVDADRVLECLLETDPQARAEWAREFKLKHDVRVTRIGHFLRRTSLDELPQLWNVVRGDMSLVGPRPVVDGELARYGADVGYYLMSKPGMTGLWQVSGRSDTDYATRVSLDVAYAKSCSFSRDITILFRTFSVVLHGGGAY